MEEMLSDKNTYEIINKDPTKKVTSDLRSLLMRWKSNKYIDDTTYRRLLMTDGVIPRAYGLTKIHKQGNPLRIIVSSINSPLYYLSSYLHNIINDSIMEAPSYIRNSFELVDKLKNVHIEPDHTLVSLDVTSLFTNVPTELVSDGITKRWDHISGKTAIPLREFLIAVHLILNSTFFTFNNKFYKQIFGTPMGSPLSPIAADIVMQDLEGTAIESLPFKLLFYLRYVDDIVLAAPSENINDILETFNSLHSRLQFTMEVGIDGKLSFLDTKLIVEDQCLVFDLYRKATFSGRFLNFNSHHPLCHKRGVIYGFVDKIIRLCHPRFQQDNLTKAINILLSNSYPLGFIFSSIQKRIKFHINNKGNSGKKIKEKFFTIPYVNSVSEKFAPIANSCHCKLAYTIPNSLKNFIKKGKDQLDPLCSNNVVYKISCEDCEASYVGQTKRQLKTRLHEHVSDINKKSKSPTVITNHRVHHNHNFDWGNVEILDKESSYNKRLISEMVHIKRQVHGINKQNDTDTLPESYRNIIQSLSPS